MDRASLKPDNLKIMFYDAATFYYLCGMKRILVAAVCALGAVLSLGAETQEERMHQGAYLQFAAVPGRTVDHVRENRGVVVNPTPVSIRWLGRDSVDVSRGFSLEKVPMALRAEFEAAATSKSIYGDSVGTHGPCVRFDKAGLPVKITLTKAKKGELPGAYTLAIKSHGVSIQANDAVGVFYAAGTLCQVVESATENSQLFRTHEPCVPTALDSHLAFVPAMEVSDRPEFPIRGVVEGFYGTPWSHEVRLRMLDHMGRNKMNSYVFGPKDDPYHRTPHWRQPYPEAEGAKIAELCQRAAKNHVNFIWAIHPGGDIRWDRADYDSLLNKFASMYDLGVRQFAVFFDDISGAGTDSHRQAALLNALNRDFVQKKQGVKPLIVCPTDYTQAWANPTDSGQLAVYGRELDPGIEVFWTGSKVCSDVARVDRTFVRERINRPSLTWWNFPVSDYVRTNLLMGPSYNLDTTLTRADMSGILSNPMEQGEASHAAVYSVADYAWNPRAYNALDSWERSLTDLEPGATQALRNFAIHATDPQKDYRKIESWETDTFRYDNYTEEQFEALSETFSNLASAPTQLAVGGANTELFKEIYPWLEQGANLGGRGFMALQLIKAYESGESDEFRNTYRLLDLVNEVQRPAWLQHRVGTQRLQPFIDQVLRDLRPFYESVSTGSAGTHGQCVR